LDVANDGALFVIGVNRPFFSTLKFRDALEDLIQSKMIDLFGSWDISIYSH